MFRGWRRVHSTIAYAYALGWVTQTYIIYSTAFMCTTGIYTLAGRHDAIVNPQFWEYSHWMPTTSSRVPSTTPWPTHYPPVRSHQTTSRQPQSQSQPACELQQLEKGRTLCGVNGTRLVLASKDHFNETACVCLWYGKGPMEMRGKSTTTTMVPVFITNLYNLRV